MSGRVMAIVLSAGLGNRVGSLTTEINKWPMAKPRFPILDTPVMHHTVLELQRLKEVSPILINLWNHPDTIRSYYENIVKLPDLIKLHNQDAMHGTMGDTVKLAVEKAGIQDEDDLVVTCGDILCDADLAKLLETHRRTGADITELFNAVPWKEVPKYGTVRLENMPQKRDRAPKESFEDYEKYLKLYGHEIDGFIARSTPFMSHKVVCFKEKIPVDTCCSNLNDTSIGVMKGKFIRDLYDIWKEQMKAGKEDDFKDFARHVFPFAIEKRLNFQGVILPPANYWIDVGDLGKLWLAIMDTLDGYFDRSMWIKLASSENNLVTSKKIAFIDPTAKVDKTATLIAPYYIGAGAVIGPGVRIERASIASHAIVGANAEVRSAVILETAYHFGLKGDGIGECDRTRVLLGTGDTGAKLERSILASGTIPHNLTVRDSIAFMAPDGHTVISPIGMNPDISIKRARGGDRVFSVE
ncbi:MAG: NDP-sugar synthase [Candidatus Saganbacteria bacterium]|nr:NDP-sugar synthase [Candidatus Saganbacteria bacterium]